MTVPKQFILFACLLALSSAAFSHSGGLNKQGCHAGSQLYHCHGKKNSAKSNVPKAGTKLTGIVTGGAYGYRVGKSLAFAYVAPEHAKAGTKLTVESSLGTRQCHVEMIAAYDAENTKLRA